MQIFTLLLSLLIGTFSSTTLAGEPRVFVHPQQNEVHLNRYHEKSRNATVKVISQLGHGTGTYVKINGSYGIITAAHVVDTGEHYIVQSGLQQTVAVLIWKDAGREN